MSELVLGTNNGVGITAIATKPSLWGYIKSVTRAWWYNQPVCIMAGQVSLKCQCGKTVFNMHKIKP